MRNSRKVIGLGDLVIDILVKVPEFPVQRGGMLLEDRMEIQPGGMGNFLVAGKRLGLDMLSLDVIGEDLFGDFLVEALRSEGIETAGIRRLADVSSKVVLVLMDKNGDHAFLGHLGENPHRQQLDQAWKHLLVGCEGGFVVGYSLLEEYIRDCAVELMGYLKADGRQVFFDPGPVILSVDKDRMNAAIRNSTVLLMTEEEAGTLSSSCGLADIRHFLSLGPTLLCIKRGPDGCTIISPGRELHCPGYPVAIMDTSGAGDSFAAAFMFGILHGYSLEQTGRLANAMGAAMVSKWGTGLNAPEKNEVIKILEDNHEPIPAGL